jgi:predicted DNA-binding transcriptional regulator AlpA
MDTTSRLLTDLEVSERYALPISSLRAGRVRGYGPPFLKLGRCVRYRSDDIERWIATKLVQPEAAS